RVMRASYSARASTGAQRRRRGGAATKRTGGSPSNTFASVSMAGKSSRPSSHLAAHVRGQKRPSRRTNSGSNGVACRTATRGLIFVPRGAGALPQDFGETQELLFHMGLHRFDHRRERIEA